ncbi:OsmC family protein [Bosea sp. (in: a-proteobacteria)]|uniref:OsmC family protein n=1 Tax=Bosea sp. (in: a-proteobacteria) TaxID=1871050 RepID=UPI0008683654|nr:OsmC family protein [Bosea sp. (in: a-proteobacteria)]MBN9439912.1 OsmC family protein [Bosea sp. (in: a-proteobacteria)]MBN9445989.1 OsmC family protein [Bosea sp. (in: a-proteobacteria)]ODT46490.1 MAG: peroxiredoxin [Methylobacterium sp. SCN 67-24]
MKARAKWVEGMAFMGEAGSGHAVVMDGAPEYGGRNIGIRPMEMLLIGLAGCTGFDVVQILKKGRENVTGCEVEVEAQRATEDPKVFTRIHISYRISGRGLSPAKAERAVALSKEKYCSASIMLGATAEMSASLEVIDELKQVAAE